jgi:hypothetical protein
VKELTVDLKVIETAREVNICIFNIAYRRESKCKVICPYILTKAISSRINSLKKCL